MPPRVLAKLSKLSPRFGRFSLIKRMKAKISDSMVSSGVDPFAKSRPSDIRPERARTILQRLRRDATFDSSGNESLSQSSGDRHDR